jgi:hypothetical protein
MGLEIALPFAEMSLILSSELASMLSQQQMIKEKHLSISESNRPSFCSLI